MCGNDDADDIQTVDSTPGLPLSRNARDPSETALGSDNIHYVNLYGSGSASIDGA